MATAKQIAWRKTFAKRYGKKKGRSKAKTQTRPSKGRIIMALRRRSYPRKVGRRVSRAYGRFRRNRQNVIPVVDVLHGIYTLDGMTDNRIHQAGENFLGAIAGNSSMSVENGIAHVQKGAEYALKNPQKAIVGGVKNFATVWVVRKVLGVVGVPKSVRIFGKTRIQVR